MLKPRLARTAEFAWPGGDRPGEIGFAHPVESNLAERILAVFGGGPGSVLAMSPPNGPLGRYHVAVGGGDWFVRVTARWAEPALEQAITAFLRERGVRVNHLEIAGAEFAFGGHTYRFDVRCLLRARHYADSLEDLRAVAATLAACHQALREFPQADAVRAFSARRFGALAAVLPEIRRSVAKKAWGRLAQDPAWGESRAGWLSEMVEKADLRFDAASSAQCLHAQMHRGNVLFDYPSDDPVLIDFEEAVHNFAPPVWDTAHLVQRFCLHDEPDAATLAARLTAVRAGYGAAPGDLTLMMRRAAWLSIAILIADHLHDGAGAPTVEYEKFTHFEEQARRYAPLLAEYSGA